MGEARVALGLAIKLKANAIGQPGQRRFHVDIEAEKGSARLWLEKEQLYALALGILHLLEAIPEGSGPSLSPSLSPRSMPLIELRIRNLAFDHDVQHDLFALLAYDMEDEDQARPTLSCWSSREQFLSLAQEALEVCAAGRPPCPLCHAPMGPEPHLCPRANGHRMP